MVIFIVLIWLGVSFSLLDCGGVCFLFCIVEDVVLGLGRSGGLGVGWKGRVCGCACVHVCVCVCCLLFASDSADVLLCVVVGGRRRMKKILSLVRVQYSYNTSLVSLGVC